MRFSNLNDWLEWQSHLHLKSIDLGLDRVSAVWSRLHPEKIPAFVITVAGTNGKGSSVAMLESILLSAGFCVGCYTSPHLVRYNERIRLNGEEAGDEQICNAFAAIDAGRDDISLSYFEFGTLAALYLFSKADLDVIILEVGLGGRLDAVNIIDADAALITGIDIDHQDWLGNDREAIGREKAGILRKQQQAVFAGTDVPDSVLAHAQKVGTKLLIAGQNYQVLKQENSWDFESVSGNRNALPIPALRGRHQLENAAGVVALLIACREQLPVSTEAIRLGLLNARIKGRFQVLQKKFPVIVDVAHNQQSIQALCNNLSSFVVKGKLHVIIGMLRDKDILNSLKPLASIADSWHLVSTPGDRGLSSRKLSEILSVLLTDKPVFQYEKVGEAFDSVLQYGQVDDSILVTGSFLVAGQFLELDC